MSTVYLKSLFALLLLLAALSEVTVRAGLSGLPSLARSSCPDPAAPQETARELYEQGRVLLARNTRTEMEKALERFDQAIACHPSFGPAYVGRAEAYTLLWSFGVLSREEALPPARTAALKALDLDESLPEAHRALAVVRLRDWDWLGAEEAFQHALQLNPEDPQTHHWYALHLSAMGRHAEALRHSRRAVALDPSPGMRVGLSAIHYFARNYPAMVDLLRDTLSRNPDFAYAYDWLGMAYVQEKQFPEALETYRKALELSEQSAEVLAGYGHAYAVAGEREQARAVLKELLKSSEQHYVPPVQVAFVYTGLGEKDKALRMLEQAYGQRSWELVFIQVEPWLDPLRSEPRFQDLVARMRFPR